MSRLPVVAIIGRPNTGKSTLFNSLVRSRLAIVSEVPGTTRDHIARKVEGEESDYLLLDTGGMGGGTEDKDFEEDVHAQSLIALEHADVILFTVNAREELTSSDREIVQLLRRKRRRHVPVVLVATKCDNPDIAERAEQELLELGMGDDVVPVSAISNIGTRDVRQAIDRHLRALHFSREPGAEQMDVTPQTPRVAIVGKPNVGKSSLVNALMSDAQREASPRLVSPVAGTTRDTTDTLITRDGKEYLLVDTAGLKRHARSERGIEGLAVLRTIQAIEDADVVVLVIDASQEVSRQDKAIAGLAVEEGKSVILVLNKIDLLKGDARKERLAELQRELLFCKWAPVLSVSAETRENLPKLFPLIDSVQRNRLRRLPVKELNSWLIDNLYGKPLGGLTTAKHITQAKDVPPTFVLFVKNPKTIRVSQLRYLENRLRETFEFAGTPVRWVTKGGRGE